MLEKHPATEEDRNWREILEWKAGSDQSGADKDAVYANALYNTFSTPDTLNYKYDAALDMYVDMPNKDNDSYYQGNAYNDDRYLRKYVKRAPQKKTIPLLCPKILLPPLYFIPYAAANKAKNKKNNIDKR